MTKAHENKLRIMAQDFLQYRYRMYLLGGQRDADYTYYKGACEMLEAFGCDWKRCYTGANTTEEENKIENYHHIVWFPDAEKCNQLDENAWK